MMEALKVMTYFKVSLSTCNWDSAFFLPDNGHKKARRSGLCSEGASLEGTQRARNRPASEALIRFASTPARMARMP